MIDDTPIEILEQAAEEFAQRECVACEWGVGDVVMTPDTARSPLPQHPAREFQAGRFGCFPATADGAGSPSGTDLFNEDVDNGRQHQVELVERTDELGPICGESRIDFSDPPLRQPSQTPTGNDNETDPLRTASTADEGIYEVTAHCTGDASASPAPSPVRFVDLADPAQRAKVLWRQGVVQAVVELMGSGVSQGQAIEQIRQRPEFSAASRSSIYNWIAAHARAGIDGLVEQKLGRSGRRSFVQSIPQELLDRARAAACEHGTGGASGAQNIARAVRTVLRNNPLLPEPAARHLHGEHASKSYVPENLRRALRVSPLARAVVQGPHAAALAAPHTVTTCDTAPGRVCTADDMTANVYCWCESPNDLGYIVGRPQILAWLDVGSHRWLVLRTIMRASGQYTRDDVWGGIGDVMDQYGVFPEWLFEGGNLWRSKLVIGESTGLSDDERFGGLKSLGCILRHSRRPQSKPIEQAFNELQYRADAFPGYCGRDERRDGPEYLDRILAACKRGQMHPRQVLPHITQYHRHVEACARELNGERQDGRALRGASPDEAWEAAKVRLPALPAAAAWLFRSAVSRVTVRRDGMIRCTLRSGKWLEEFFYRNPEVLMPRCGQPLIAYWNDRNPEADAVLMTAAKRPEFVGCAQYVQPISRFDATDEEMAKEAAARKAAMAFARTEVSRLQPHFERAAGRLQTMEQPVIYPVQRIGAEMQQAEERAEAAAAAAVRASDLDSEQLLARRAAR